MVKVCPIGVIGPLPADFRTLIVLSNKDKAVVVPCSYGEGESCAKMMVRVEKNGCSGPYDCIPDIVAALGGALDQAILFRQDDEFMASVYVSRPKGPRVKVTSDSPALAINLAISTGECPLFVEKTAWAAAAPAEQAVLDLAASMTLWPMPRLTNTNDLRTLSNFMDKVLPDGRVFKT
jgi:hypothetical protein